MHSIFKLFILLLCYHKHQTFGMCPPLVAPKGTFLACEDPVYSQRLDCSASWLQQGTIARFRCVNDEKMQVKGRVLCFDGGFHQLHNRLKMKTKLEMANLPCKIRENSNKEEMHLYGYEITRNFPLHKDNISDFHLLGLTLHNKFRKAHGSRPLELRGNLSALAQGWANKIVQTGRLDMATESRFGQNVFLAKGIDMISAVNEAIHNWYYSGLKEYRWDNVSDNWDSSTALQFSQLVWNSSKDLGIGSAKMSGLANRTVVVAFYDPPGNVLFENDEEMSESSFVNNVFTLDLVR